MLEKLDMWRKRTLVHCYRNVNWYSHYGDYYEDASKIKCKIITLGHGGSLGIFSYAKNVWWLSSWHDMI